MTVLDRSRPTALNFQTERERLLAPFVQRSAEAARRILASLGDLREYYAQFSRDEAFALKMIVGDLTRSASI